MICTSKNIPEEIVDEDVYYNKGASSTKTRGLRDFHNLFVKSLFEFIPGHYAFNGIYHFKVYKWQDQKTGQEKQRVALTGFRDNLYDKNEQYSRGSILNAIAMLRTKDGKWMLSPRGVFGFAFNEAIGDYKKTANGEYEYNANAPLMPAAGAVDACTYSERDDLITKLGKMQPKELQKYLEDCLIDTAKKELSEEYLRNISDTLTDAKIMGHNESKRKNITKNGKTKETTDLQNFFIALQSDKTSEELTKEWKDEKNRGDDWLELPAPKFYTSKEIDKIKEKLHPSLVEVAAYATQYDAELGTRRG
jgi:hypothetical protein